MTVWLNSKPLEAGTPHQPTPDSTSHLTQSILASLINVKRYLIAVLTSILWFVMSFKYLFICLSGFWFPVK